MYVEIVHVTCPFSPCPSGSVFPMDFLPAACVKPTPKAPLSAARLGSAPPRDPGGIFTWKIWRYLKL